MNNDIIVLLQQVAHECDLLTLLHTCQTFYQFKKIFIFRDRQLRQSNHVHRCIHQYANIYEYTYQAQDVCEYLELNAHEHHDTHENQFRLPSQLRHLSIHIDKYDICKTQRWFQNETRLIHLKLRIEKMSITFLPAEHFELQIYESHNHSSDIMIVHLPHNLEKLSLTFNIFNIEFQLLHVHTLKIPSYFHDYLSYVFPNLRILKVELMNEYTILPSTLHELYVFEISNLSDSIQFFDHLQILRIDRGEGQINHLPDQLRVLIIKSHEIMINCSFPSHLKHLHWVTDQLIIKFENLPDTLHYLHIYACNNLHGHVINHIPPHIKKLTIDNRRGHLRLNCVIPSTLTHLKIPSAIVPKNVILPDDMYKLNVFMMRANLPSRLIKLNVDQLKYQRSLPDTLQKVIIQYRCDRILSLPSALQYLQLNNYQYELHVPSHVKFVHT